MMPAPAQLRDFAKRYTAAWKSHNPASVAAFFSPNGSLSVNGAPAVGRRAITEVAQGFMTAFPDLDLLMDDLVLQGDRAEWKFGEDGLIAESQGHFDAAVYQRQLQRGVEDPQ